MTRVGLMLCGLVLFGDKVGVSGTTPVCRR